MTPDQIALVQASFADIAPIADTVATLFYQRLFTLDPSLRQLFPAELDDQGRKLMAMLRLAVYGLDRLDRIVSALTELGRRHAGYNVQDAHYATVGAALLWTLEQGLGERWTPEIAAAWMAAYTLLAETMQQAAREAPYRVYGRVWPSASLPI